MRARNAVNVGKNILTMCYWLILLMAIFWKIQKCILFWRSINISMHLLNRFWSYGLSFAQQLSNLKKLNFNIYCFITASPIAWFTELHKQFPSTFDWWRWWRKRFSHIRCIYNHTRKMLQPDDVTRFKYNHDIMCEIFFTSQIKNR